MRLFDKIARFKNYQRKITNRKNTEYYSERGCIVIKRNTPNLILTEEQGQFTEGRYANKTLNYYQWQLVNEHFLQLSHLRNGKQDGELLATFNLTKTDAHPIVSTPYLCGQDLYTANLIYLEYKLILSWEVKGPTKDLLIESNYFSV